MWLEARLYRLCRTMLSLCCCSRYKLQIKDVVLSQGNQRFTGEDHLWSMSERWISYFLRKTVKQLLFCTECVAGHYVNKTFEYKPGDPDIQSLDFDRFCSTLHPAFWIWVTISAVIIIALVTLFLLRGKLPCLSQKRAVDTETTLTNG